MNKSSATGLQVWLLALLVPAVPALWSLQEKARAGGGRSMLQHLEVRPPRLMPRPPHVVFLIGEDEYQTAETLPKFAADELEPKGLRCVFVHADPKKPNEFPGIEKLREADLLVLSVRRRIPPDDQLAVIRHYLAAGKPLVGIRTASHAFALRDQPGGWPEFDRDVLGGDYQGHHGVGQESIITSVEARRDHPILTGVGREFRSKASLYKNRKLASTATPLLVGRLENHAGEPEFVAWTNRHQGGRIFYTSLGSVDDFAEPNFRRLLLNAIFWALDREIPAR
ncbi:MAG: ThuA domain-containing protein [Gemmataceae bacterium]|nr:ThuA domain-containing protein [Gemmataceae bacterium]